MNQIRPLPNGSRNQDTFNDVAGIVKQRTTEVVTYQQADASPQSNAHPKGVLLR